jgi:hypothetical protein
VEDNALVWMGADLVWKDAVATAKLVDRFGPRRLEVRLLAELPERRRDGLEPTLVFDGEAILPSQEARWYERARSSLGVGAHDRLPLDLLRDPKRPTWLLDGSTLFPLGTAASPRSPQ